MPDNDDVKTAELEKAVADLRPEMTLPELAGWWKTHYATLGHKRLGRAMVEFDKKHNTDTKNENIILTPVVAEA